jgi:hypothetical protein
MIDEPLDLACRCESAARSSGPMNSTRAGELKALKHFGNLVSSTGRETFRATPAERAEACRILVERGFSLPASPLRPDPHTVLSGLPEDSAACRDRCAP